MINSLLLSEGKPLAEPQDKEDSTLLDKQVVHQILEKEAHIRKRQQVFYSKLSRQQNLMDLTDDTVLFFKKCQDAQVLCAPLLNRVHNHTLVL